MTNYKNIFGKPVKFLTTDPDNDAAEGQIWYNSTAGVFKDLIASAAWSSGGNLVTATALMAGAGTQTAGLGFGGYVGPGTPNVVNTTLEYNGSGWAVGGNLVAARSGMGGTGTQTAALGFGGSTTIPRAPGEVANSEEYNGTSWTEGNNLNDALVGIGGLGTQTAAVGFGGGTPDTNATEHYDGTSWTNVPGTLTSARRYLQGCGTQTAGLTAGGSGTSSNLYNGTAWTAGANMNTSRPNTGAVSGIQTSALMSGGGSGGTPVGGKTELYDGTSWSEVADMAVGRYSSAGANGGTTSASLAFGGYLGGTGYISSTEEWNKTANVITPAAFSSGNNMSEARSKIADGGTQTAAVGGGGQKNNPDSSPTGSEEYNGTSWTSGNALPTTYGSNTGATGTQTALVTGGANNPTPGFTFEYNGTNWTAGGTLGTSRYAGKTLGTQTAAVTCGGRVSPPTLNNVEEYDGSSWTAVTAMPIATREQGGFGIQTAGTVVSGFQGPSSPPVSPAPASRGALGFDYDGTSWTAGTSAIIAGSSGGAAGVQTNAIFLAGSNPGLSPGLITTSQKYDGTSYTTDAAVGRSRATAFGITSSRTSAVGSAAMIFGGGDPAATPQDTAATEEYNVATSALNIKTITTS